MNEKHDKEGLNQNMQFVLTLIGTILAVTFLAIVFSWEKGARETTIIQIILTFLLVCVNVPMVKRTFNAVLCIFWTIAFAISLLALAPN